MKRRPNRPKPTEEQREQIASHYLLNTPVAEIAAQYAVHFRVVYEILEEYGVPKRGRGANAGAPRGITRLERNKMQAVEERREQTDDKILRLQRAVRAGYPTSGDPNIIGEHEVPPVCCPHCRKTLPWQLLKGWRA
jgi:hypothetical protein